MFKFLKKLKKNNFEEEFDKLVSNSKPDNLEVEDLNFEINQVIDKFEFPNNSKDFDEVDKYFVEIIKELREFYENKREKLGKEIMRNKTLIELNQLIFAIDKNLKLMYRDEFNLEEFLNYEKILIEQVKKLK